MPTRSHLSVIARNDHITANPIPSPEDLEMLAEEIGIAQRGVPDFELFEAASKEGLEAQIEEWRQAEVIGNPIIDGVTVMSPTVSADGTWRAAVNFLIFLDGAGPVF